MINVCTAVKLVLQKHAGDCCSNNTPSVKRIKKNDPSNFVMCNVALLSTQILICAERQVFAFQWHWCVPTLKSYYVITLGNKCH